MKAEDSKHEEFMRRFIDCQRGLLRYVMCFVPNANDARDIVQNTAIALWKKYNQYDPSEPFMPWACRFALNETRLFLRTEQRWQRFINDDTIELLAERRGQLLEELDERRIHLRACLRKLPEKQKTLLEGYYFKDLTIEQLSDLTGRSAAALYKGLQRVRSILFDCVNRRLQVVAKGTK